MRKLSCQEAEPLLEAFHANELDGVSSLAVQEHVEQCPLCQRRLRWNSEADNSLRRLVEATPAASSALRARVLGIPREERRIVPVQFRRNALAIAAAIIAFLAIASVWYFGMSRPAQAMAFVENHNATLAKSEPVELRTSDAAEAERWIHSRLGFTAAVPRAPEYRLIGARLCKINKTPVAFLLYEHGGESLSCFVSAGSYANVRGFDALSENRVRTGTCEGKNIAAWDTDQAGYLVVGNLPRESLIAFADESARNFRQPAGPVR